MDTDNERPLYDEGFYTSAERKRNSRIPWTFFVWCLLAVFSTFMFMLTILFAWHLSLFALPWILFSLSFFFREPREYRTEQLFPPDYVYVPVQNSQPLLGNSNTLEDHSSNWTFDPSWTVPDVSERPDFIPMPREERRILNKIPKLGSFRKPPVDFIKETMAAPDRKLWESDPVGEVQAS
ncbi:hypothetical protein ABW21_db0209740 [Orbilia brochopaga]|nr:hypothetical protein ABW21_db0209740 [Drechslerella brochopaga]